MELSKQGFEFLARREDIVLHSYYDTGNVLTVGLGHTGPDVHEGMIITMDQAMDLFTKDRLPRERLLNQMLRVPVTQTQYDALFSFMFNVGATNLANSTLLKMLNNNDFVGAAAQFKRWNRDNGQIVQGLVNRRAFEEHLFVNGIYG